MRRNTIALAATLAGIGLLLSAAASAQTGPPGTVATWLIPFVKSTNDNEPDTVTNTHITLTYNAGLPASPFATGCASAVFFYNKNGTPACGVPMPLPPNNSRTICSGEPDPDVSSMCDAACAPELLSYEGYARIFVTNTPACQDGVTVDPRVHYHPEDEESAEAVHSPKIVRTNNVFGPDQIGD